MHELKRKKGRKKWSNFKSVREENGLCVGKGLYLMSGEKLFKGLEL